MKMVKKSLLGLLGMLIIASGAQADDTIQTEPVTVTVNRIEQQLRDVPVSVGIITEEDIRRNPQTNVADLLQGIPGVSLEDGSMAGGKRVSIRGEGSSRVLILIDGVKISEQKSMSGAAILVDPSNIERIEVIKGPASVLYGSEAIGGVVNIITKRGGPNPVGGSVKMTYDSSTNSIEPVLALFGSYEGFNYRFTGSGINANDRITPEGSLDNTAYDQRAYSGQLGYDWSKGGIYFKADRYTSDMDLPGTREFPMNIEMDLPTWNRTTYSMGLEQREITDNLVKLKANVYYQNMEKDFYNHIMVAPSPMAPVTHTELYTSNDQDSYGGTAQSEWILFKDHYVVLGFDCNRDELGAKTDDNRWRIMPMGTYVPTSHNYYNYDGSLTTASVFLQDEWSFAEQWKLQLGGRQTWINSKLDSSNDPKAVVNEETDSNLVGNIGLVFTPIEELALRAHVAQGYRFPNLNQLYIGTAHGSSGYTYGNPNLQPEESINYEVGARYSANNLNLDAAVYYSDSKNYITNRQMGASNMFVNLDTAKTIGFELGADYTIQPVHLTPYVTFSWLRRETENSGFTTTDAGVAPVQGQAGVKWQNTYFNHLFFCDFNLTYASEAKTSTQNGSTGAVATIEDGAWTTFNITLGVEGKSNVCDYFATLSFRNILDQEYNYSQSTLIEPGFHVVAAVGVEF